MVPRASPPKVTVDALKQSITAVEARIQQYHTSTDGKISGLIQTLEIRLGTDESQIRILCDDYKRYNTRFENDELTIRTLQKNVQKIDEEIQGFKRFKLISAGAPGAVDNREVDLACSRLVTNMAHQVADSLRPAIMDAKKLELERATDPVKATEWSNCTNAGIYMHRAYASVIWMSNLTMALTRVVEFEIRESLRGLSRNVETISTTLNNLVARINTLAQEFANHLQDLANLRATVESLRGQVVEQAQRIDQMAAQNLQVAQRIEGERQAAVNRENQLRAAYEQRLQETQNNLRAEMLQMQGQIQQQIAQINGAILQVEEPGN